jgi:hypothetical protein
MEIITLNQAREQGLKFYFNAKPCPKGHVAKRLTSNQRCYECAKAGSRQYAKDNPDINRAKASAWYYANHEKARGWRNDYAKRQGAKEVARQNERASLRQRSVLGQLALLSEEDKKRTKAIYQLRLQLSKDTGVVFHVDHYVPLSKGGLHTPSNLWVIPAAENMKKSAKLPEDLAA